MGTSRAVTDADREAPIFELADFGVVGGLFQVLPQLMDGIAKRSGQLRPTRTPAHQVSGRTVKVFELALIRRLAPG